MRYLGIPGLPVYDQSVTCLADDPQNLAIRSNKRHTPGTLSNLRFCLTSRSFIGIRRFKRLEFRLEILFPFNLLKQVFATVKFDLDPD